MKSFSAFTNLNEAQKEFPQKDIDKLASMTDRNDHSGAALFLASKLHNKKYTTVMKSLQAIHNALGSMPYELGQFRFSMLKQMWDEAGKKFSNGDDVKAAF